MPTLNPNKIAEGLTFRFLGDAVAGGRGGLLGREGAHDDSAGPCAGCPHAARCAGGMACEQFAMFIRFGGDKRWRPAPRVPSREIFAVLFPDAVAV